MVLALVVVPRRSRSNRFVSDGETCFKETAHTLMGLASLKSAEQEADWRPREELEGSLLAEFSLPRGPSVFFCEDFK